MHDEDATPPISEEMFTRTRAALKAIYRDAKAPTIVRRRALEAAVRAEDPGEVVLEVGLEERRIAEFIGQGAGLDRQRLGLGELALADADDVDELDQRPQLERAVLRGAVDPRPRPLEGRPRGVVVTLRPLDATARQLGLGR